MPIPPTPPRREPMSDAEKALRDRLRRRTMGKIAVWDDRPDDMVDKLLRFSFSRHREPVGVYTKVKLVDDRYWSMQYKWVKTRPRYELVRSSVRYHAKRKDARDRAWRLHRERSV